MESESIVLDSSALVAILLREPGFERIEKALARAKSIFMSSATRLEVCMVMSGRKIVFSEYDMIEAEQLFSLQIESFTADHAVHAFAAFRRFGKGNHKAGLNFGDCQAYATAKLANLPLLFIGNDFGHTDLKTVKI